MIEHKKQFTKIFQKIQQANNVLIVGHKKPDGDCLGAGCALGSYFNSIDKKYTLFNVDNIPETFSYLVGVKKAVSDLSIIEQEKFDLVILLDTGSIDYSGIQNFLQTLPEHTEIINIDHHLSNTNYGKINLVVTYASSTSEIIYYLFKYNKIYIDKDVANCLLTGIISDSGTFSNAATTIASIEAASHLLICGGRLPKIIKKNYQNQSLSALRLWGLVLSRLEKNSEYDLAYTYLTYNDLEQYQATEEDVSGVANFLNNLEEGKAIFFIKEGRPGEVSVSTRTTRDDIDLSALAKACGGGGHKKAAGFSFKGKLIEGESGLRVE